MLMTANTITTTSTTVLVTVTAASQQTKREADSWRQKEMGNKKMTDNKDNTV